MSDTGSVLEVQLLRWNEGPSGRTVTFLLHEDTVQHPFRGLRTGPSNGQRLAIACSLIADDETTTPVEPPSTAPEKPKGGRLAQQAGICCQDARFRKFLRDVYGYPVSAADEARDAIYTLCGVESRTAFDANSDAAQRWHNLHGEYIVWRDNP